MSQYRNSRPRGRGTVPWDVTERQHPSRHPAQSPDREVYNWARVGRMPSRGRGRRPIDRPEEEDRRPGPPQERVAQNRRTRSVAAPQRGGNVEDIQRSRRRARSSEVPFEHRIEFLRFRPIGGAEPEQMPPSFRPRTLRVAVPQPAPHPQRERTPPQVQAARRVGCWNCGEDHRFRECTARLEERRFCFGCGASEVTKRTCPKCREDWEEGLQVYWRQNRGK